jgi:hypothetical protein
MSAYNITRENNTKSNTLLDKLKNTFTDTQQQLFIESFYMYLNHDQEKDYVMDLDKVYSWLGFERKGKCKELLIKHFQENIDYKITTGSSYTKNEKLASPDGEASFSEEKHGGQNKETILMNIKTFKKLSLKAGTKKADSIHDYYITMETTVQKHLVDTFQEERKQIQNETKSNMLIEQYKDKRIVYLGMVKETSEYNIIKYGCTKQVKDTLTRHRNTYGSNFNYIYMTECQKHDELERKIQTHNDLVSRHIKEFDGNSRHELLRIESTFNIDKLIMVIESLKESMEIKYSLELELAREVTKQKELETKQKELEINLELKKLDVQLEMFKLKCNLNKNDNNLEVVHVIKEFFDTCTIYSNNNLDTIKMSDLYKKFIEWLKNEHPKEMFSQRQFTNKFNQLKVGIYDAKISNLNGNSGIRNRKFKN